MASLEGLLRDKTSLHLWVSLPSPCYSPITCWEKANCHFQQSWNSCSLVLIVDSELLWAPTEVWVFACVCIFLTFLLCGFAFLEVFIYFAFISVYAQQRSVVAVSRASLQGVSSLLVIHSPTTTTWGAPGQLRLTQATLSGNQSNVIHAY